MDIAAEIRRALRELRDAERTRHAVQRDSPQYADALQLERRAQVRVWRLSSEGPGAGTGKQVNNG